MQVLPALLLAGCVLAARAADDSILDAKGKRGCVLIFFGQDCPICNSYAPEINRLCAAYTNFSFYVVQVDPDLTPAAAQKHAQEYGLLPSVLLDGNHHLVKLAGAVATPEAVVFGPSRQICYRGRIDNLYPNLSQRRAVATVHDLRDALDAIASGKSIKAETPVMGCLIQNP